MTSPAKRRRRGGGREAQDFRPRDFDIGLMYIFLLADVFRRRRRILEIIFCIFSIWGGGGAVSWTVTGPHKALFLPAVYC